MLRIFLLAIAIAADLLVALILSGGIAPAVRSPCRDTGTASTSAHMAGRDRASPPKPGYMWWAGGSSRIARAIEQDDTRSPGGRHPRRLVSLCAVATPIKIGALQDRASRE